MHFNPHFPSAGPALLISMGTGTQRPPAAESESSQGLQLYERQLRAANDRILRLLKFLNDVFTDKFPHCNNLQAGGVAGCLMDS